MTSSISPSTVSSATVSPGPSVGRRELLRLSLGGLTLPSLLSARATAKTSVAGDRTAVILVWLKGRSQPPRDLRSQALSGSAYRGPYDPIATQTPGMRICELLPHHAKVSNRFSLLRSMVHTGFCHQQGTQQLLTGHPVRILKQKPDHPDLFSIVHRLRRSAYSGLPNYVGVNPVPYAGPGPPRAGLRTVCRHRRSQRQRIPGAQHRAQDKQKLARMRERIGLRRSLDRLSRDADQYHQMKALDEFETQAWTC
ncbi:MAG: hypothetical protein CM1200mP2_49190 [Planctomycetaceae bacterium]|nr:MAG: hypothetical protein CM1200mP2_49190 [Planctomycetaceae bacterium]